MSISDERFVRALAERSPELKGMLADHLAAYRGELLPHLYLGEVAAWLVDALGRGDRMGEVRSVLAFLEDQLETDASVSDLIVLSFLENLPLPREPGAGIRDLLGANLRRELSRLEG